MTFAELISLSAYTPHRSIAKSHNRLLPAQQESKSLQKLFFISLEYPRDAKPIGELSVCSKWQIVKVLEIVFICTFRKFIEHFP